MYMCNVTPIINRPYKLALGIITFKFSSVWRIS